MEGQELLQPLVTLTSASYHTRASFILLREAYLAFPHGGRGPALPVKSPAWLQNQTAGRMALSTLWQFEKPPEMAFWDWKWKSSGAE